MLVIIPSLICLIINIIIFKYVRTSTSRVQTLSAVVTYTPHQYLSRRGLHLLPHLIFMFCIVVGGCSPINLYLFINWVNPNFIMLWSFMMLAELSTLVDIINFFLYNHELRRYLFKVYLDVKYCFKLSISATIFF